MVAITNFCYLNYLSYVEIEFAQTPLTFRYVRIESFKVSSRVNAVWCAPTCGVSSLSYAKRANKTYSLS